MTTATANPYSAPAAEMGGGEETYQPQIFSFSGRIGRLRYLAYGLAWNAVIVAAIFVLGLLGALVAGEGAVAVVTLVGYAGTLVPMFVLAVRRLNDMDASGWLSLLLIVPFVNFIMALVLIFAPGTKGPNKYGAAPVDNSTGVIIAALIFPMLAILGIIAAIALPAYQEYTIRAEAAQTQQLELQ